MKKKLAVIALMLVGLMSVSCLTACTMKYNLIFMYDETNTHAHIRTAGKEEIQMPNNPERAGYRFGGWYIDEACTQEFNADIYRTEPLTENIHIYPKWIPKTEFDVSFNANGGKFSNGTEIYTINSIPKDTSIPADKVPADPTREGYTFKGWSRNKDGSGALFDLTISVTTDFTLFAVWEEVAA